MKSFIEKTKITNNIKYYKKYNILNEFVGLINNPSTTYIAILLKDLNNVNFIVNNQNLTIKLISSFYEYIFDEGFERNFPENWNFKKLILQEMCFNLILPDNSNFIDFDYTKIYYNIKPKLISNKPRILNIPYQRLLNNENNIEFNGIIEPNHKGLLHVEKSIKDKIYDIDCKKFYFKFDIFKYEMPLKIEEVYINKSNLTSIDISKYKNLKKLIIYDDIFGKYNDFFIVTKNQRNLIIELHYGDKIKFSNDFKLSISDNKFKPSNKHIKIIRTKHLKYHQNIRKYKTI
jgi:hypothetical protein